jgi:hypothetical protein
MSSGVEAVNLGFCCFSCCKQIHFIFDFFFVHFLATKETRAKIQCNRRIWRSIHLFWCLLAQHLLFLTETNNPQLTLPPCENKITTNETDWDSHFIGITFFIMNYLDLFLFVCFKPCQLFLSACVQMGLIVYCVYVYFVVTTLISFLF